MDAKLLANLLHRLSDLPPVWHVLWAGLVMLSIALVVLARTRWGQSKPMRKCAVLSLLAHVLLACLATSIKIVTTAESLPSRTMIRVSIASDESGNTDADMEGPAAEPLQDASDEELTWPKLSELASLDRLEADAPRPADAAIEPKATEPTPPSPRAADHPSEELEAASTPVPPPPREESPIAELSAVEAVEPSGLAAETANVAPPASLLPAVDASPAETPSDGALTAADTDPPPRSPSEGPASPHESVAYGHRSNGQRTQLLQDHGGSDATEAAVARALQWLSRAQSQDGRWDAVRHGAGRELVVLGHDRQGAGAEADTGVTGLALLAFLGAGHTHREGPFQENVRKGLEFLIASQAEDGDLAGGATLFARMYCHAMAAFALSEACAMTGDDALRDSVQKAVDHIVRAQHTGGGWRYRSGDAGDTSQHGWQLMALESAELAGANVPDQTWQRAEKFLESVSRGRAGGLAAYQPQTGVSRSMSAEAAYCRLLLAERTDRLEAVAKGGLAPGPIRNAPEFADHGRVNDPVSKRPLLTLAGDETAAYIRAELPGAGQANLYYWYYATLFLHLRQDQGATALEDWRTWNEALKNHLLPTQYATGPLEGAWGSDTMWGGYGGRVYTTALAALCLETYYRFLPLAPGQQDRTAARAGLLHQRAFDTRGGSDKID